MLIVCDTFRKKVLPCKKTSETFIHVKQTCLVIDHPVSCFMSCINLKSTAWTCADLYYTVLYFVWFSFFFLTLNKVIPKLQTCTASRQFFNNFLQIVVKWYFRIKWMLMLVSKYWAAPGRRAWLPITWLPYLAISFIPPCEPSQFDIPKAQLVLFFRWAI